jgi:hypothetical protein
VGGIQAIERGGIEGGAEFAAVKRGRLGLGDEGGRVDGGWDKIGVPDGRKIAGSPEGGQWGGGAEGQEQE